MRIEGRLHFVHADPELGRQQCGDARRPAEPGVALLAGEAEHEGDGTRPVDNLALQLLQSQPAFLRLQHLIGHGIITTTEIAMNTTMSAGITRSEAHYRPWMRMVWRVLESAKDAGIADVVAACRWTIVNDWAGRRIDTAAPRIIHEAYADLRDW